jgi:hypothetical protein
VPKKGKSDFCELLSNLKITSPAPITVKWGHGTSETVDRNSKILAVGITKEWPNAGGRYPKLKRAYNMGVQCLQEKVKYRPQKRPQKFKR